MVPLSQAAFTLRFLGGFQSAGVPADKSEPSSWSYGCLEGSSCDCSRTTILLSFIKWWGITLLLRSNWGDLIWECKLQDYMIYGSGTLIFSKLDFQIKRVGHDCWGLISHWALPVVYMNMPMYLAVSTDMCIVVQICSGNAMLSMSWAVELVTDVIKLRCFTTYFIGWFCSNTVCHSWMVSGLDAS